MSDYDWRADLDWLGNFAGEQEMVAKLAAHIEFQEQEIAALMEVNRVTNEWLEEVGEWMRGIPLSSLERMIVTLDGIIKRFKAHDEVA